MSHLFQFLEIETFSYCNLACPTCPVSLCRREKHYLEEACFYSLIDELAAINFAGTFSPHFYSEPFADHRISRLIRYVVDKLPQARIVIFTNATLLTPEILRQMPNSRIHEYIVTIDNPKILKAYQALIEMLEPEEHQLFRTRSIVQDGMYNRGGMIMDIPHALKVKHCDAPMQYCIINAWGDVVLCYNDYISKHTFGNIMNESVVNIWNKPEFIKARQQISEGIFDLQICQRCEVNFS